MTLKIPSNFSAKRRLQFSHGTFTQTRWQPQFDLNEVVKAPPVKIQEVTARGVIGHYSTKDIKNIDKANIQTVDTASLNADCDTLIVTYTMKVLPLTGDEGFVSNDPHFDAKLKSIQQQYIAGGGLSELATRYAHNIVNARCLFRNRVGAHDIKVCVYDATGELLKPIPFIDHGEEKPFNAYDYSMVEFPRVAAVEPVAKLIEAGLTERIVTIKVIVLARIGFGQEVFPSEIFSRDTGKREHEKSKTLFRVDKDNAGLRDAKIGNAIRCIDDWYPCAEYPISVEPYGQETILQVVHRPLDRSKSVHFYALLQKVMNDDAIDEAQMHYLMAMFVRGGGFSGGKEKKENGGDDDE